MNAQTASNTPVLQGPARAFAWSIRRELWEHRSIYMAPAIAAGLVITGVVLAHVPGSHVEMKMDAAGNVFAAILPYLFAAGVILGTSLLVAFAYCLSALHNERRDRSILFWKSLPVSDAATVASKAVVVMVVLPVVAVAATLCLQLLITMVGAASGKPPSGAAIKVISTSLLYGPIVLSLWYAPIYGWLVLVSSWAKRGTFLWAILPPLGVCVLEAIVFHTHHFAELLSLRLNGGFGAAFALGGTPVTDKFGLPTVSGAQFFTSPDLWIGLLVAAAFFAAAVYQRRRAEPI